jgi:hypothetical protein
MYYKQLQIPLEGVRIIKAEDVITGTASLRIEQEQQLIKEIALNKDVETMVFPDSGALVITDRQNPMNVSIYNAKTGQLLLECRNFTYVSSDGQYVVNYDPSFLDGVYQRDYMSLYQIKDGELIKVGSCPIATSLAGIVTFKTNCFVLTTFLKDSHCRLPDAFTYSIDFEKRECDINDYGNRKKYLISDFDMLPEAQRYHRLYEESFIKKNPLAVNANHSFRWGKELRDLVLAHGDIVGHGFSGEELSFIFNSLGEGR